VNLTVQRRQSRSSPQKAGPRTGVESSRRDDPPPIVEPTVSTDAEVRRHLYAELREYEQAEVAEVGARVRPACSTARSSDAELQALAVVADVLRLRHRGAWERDLALALSLSPSFRSER
jgi:hypothetical protein